MKTHPVVSLFMLLAIFVFFVCTIGVRDQEIPFGAFVAEADQHIVAKPQLTRVYTKYVINGVAHRMTRNITIHAGDEVKLLKVVQPGWKKVVFIALLISLVMMIGIGMCKQDELQTSAQVKTRTEQRDELFRAQGLQQKPLVPEKETSTD